MSELPADVITASAALVLVVLVVWFALKIIPVLTRQAQYARESRDHLAHLTEIRDNTYPIRLIHDDLTDHAEKSDDTDWAEKYQSLALAVAAIIGDEYEAPTTYTEVAALGYKDGAEEVVRRLRLALKDG